jgi:heme exporter protein D
MPDPNFGKYAAYIWPAYLITALVFAGLIVGSLRLASRWKRRAEALGHQGLKRK